MPIYNPKEVQRAAAAARRRLAKQDMRPAPPENDPLANAAYEAGGLLLSLVLKLPEGPNGGCGTLTHVAGTNGGRIPCGVMLTENGKTEPYFCGHCKPMNPPSPQLKKSAELAGRKGNHNG